MSTAEKKDGKKDGDLMKLDSKYLKLLIAEVLQENTQSDDVKLQNKMMTGGQFVTQGKEQRKQVDPEVDNNERAIINQIDDFLLKMAEKPGVDLQKYRLQIQTVLNKLNAVVDQVSTQAQAANPESQEP
tara:strand:- start:57 stop:443 length:387 start_codon:yes stop_codon:yes gene_type:complete